MQVVMRTLLISEQNLGVTIDTKLHWSDHINSIKSRANKRLYFVWKLGQFKVERTLITFFYKSVIESVLSFRIICWGGNNSKGDRMKVDRIIKNVTFTCIAISFHIYCRQFSFKHFMLNFPEGINKVFKLN